MCKVNKYIAKRVKALSEYDSYYVKADYYQWKLDRINELVNVLLVIQSEGDDEKCQDN